jgi:glycosyltransferase involved in cell wall biosynthesis
MLSLIICSQNAVLSNALSRNIEETVGVDHEIVHIDNSQRKYSIFEAYNKGVEQAHGEYLCFMHEDISYHSQNWGQAVVNHLSQPFVGAIGVAGGCVIPDRLDWRFLDYQTTYLIQGSYTEEENPRYYVSSPAKKAKNPSLVQVATLDGVWICIRRDLFQQIRFDDQTFHDFHLYDSDICMQINQLGLGVFVTYDVLLEHKSMGVFSDSYQENLEIFHRKWKDCLPMVKGMMLSKEEIDHAVEEAQDYFNGRMSDDHRKIELRRLLIQKSQRADTRKLTKQEKKRIDKSAYRCRRVYLKDKKMTTSEAWTGVKEYLRSPYAKKRGRLLSKFLWYRIIHRKH